MGHIAYVIDDELHRRAKALAARRGQTFRAWIEAAIGAAVDQQEADDAEAQRKRRSR